MTDGAAHSEGRRPKTSKGGNRELGRCGGAASALPALWGFDRDGSIDGKRAARSMATVDEQQDADHRVHRRDHEQR